MKKRIMSFLLVLVMVLGMVPVPAFAGEGCTYHPEHNSDCGYSEGTPCGFDHAANCTFERVVRCAHTHGEGSCTYAAAKPAVNCHPTHNEACGYVPGVDCTCGAAAGEAHQEGCAFVAETPCNVTHEGCGCTEAVPASGECNHTCAAEPGCEVTENHICAHTVCDDTCGFEAATDCTFVCTVCNPPRRKSSAPATAPTPASTHLPVTSMSAPMKSACACRTALWKARIPTARPAGLRA